MENTISLVLEKFQQSSASRSQGQFNPEIAIRASYENAKKPWGTKAFLCTFFSFLANTSGAGPTSTVESSLEAVKSMMYAPSEQDRLMLRVRDWAYHLNQSLLAPMSSRGARSGLPTPIIKTPLMGSHTTHSVTTEKRREIAQQCHLRDHHKCVITKAFDDVQTEKRSEKDDDPTDDEGNPLDKVQIDILEVAHIIPHCLNTVQQSESELVSTSFLGSLRSDQSAAKKSARDLLDMMDPGILKHLDGSEVDDPKNCVCLTQRVHGYFGSLDLALEPTDDWTTTNQRYKVVVYKHPVVVKNMHLPSYTVFYGDVSNVPMPSRRFLEIHAACARIKHLCGAGEIIQRWQDELGEDGVAADGTTDLSSLIMARLGGVQIATY